MTLLLCTSRANRILKSLFFLIIKVIQHLFSMYCIKDWLSRLLHLGKGRIYSTFLYIKKKNPKYSYDFKWSGFPISEHT